MSNGLAGRELILLVRAAPERERMLDARVNSNYPLVLQGHRSNRVGRLVCTVVHPDLEIVWGMILRTVSLSVYADLQTRNESYELASKANLLFD